MASVTQPSSPSWSCPFGSPSKSGPGTSNTLPLSELAGVATPCPLRVENARSCDFTLESLSFLVADFVAKSDTAQARSSSLDDTHPELVCCGTSCSTCTQKQHKGKHTMQSAGLQHGEQAAVATTSKRRHTPPACMIQRFFCRVRVDSPRYYLCHHRPRRNGRARTDAEFLTLETPPSRYPNSNQDTHAGRNRIGSHSWPDDSWHEPTSLRHDERKHAFRERQQFQLTDQEFVHCLVNAVSCSTRPFHVMVHSLAHML